MERGHWKEVKGQQASMIDILRSAALGWSIDVHTISQNQEHDILDTEQCQVKLSRSCGVKARS